MGRSSCSDSRPSDHADRSVPRSRVGSVAVIGVLALAATKTTDFTTTVVGLRASPLIVERNPVAVAFIEEYGLVPGLLGLSLLSVAAIVVLIEGVFWAARPLFATHRGRLSPRTARYACYGVACLCNLSFAAHNTAVILSVTG